MIKKFKRVKPKPEFGEILAPVGNAMAKLGFFSKNYMTTVDRSEDNVWMITAEQALNRWSRILLGIKRLRDVCSALYQS